MLPNPVSWLICRACEKKSSYFRGESQQHPDMNRFLNILGSLSLLLLVGALIYGCSGCGGPEEPTGPVFKNNDNTLRVRLASEPDRLNPYLTVSGYARPVYQEIFLPLLEYNHETFEPTPALAIGRPVIEEITDGAYAGGMKYTYELNEYATFSDGKPLRVEDVIFSFKLLFNLNIAEAAPHRNSYLAVADVVPDAENPRKFTVFAKEKYILAEDSYSGTNIYPEHIFDPEGLMADYQIADLIANGEALAEEAPLQQFAEQFRSAPFSRDASKLIGTGPYLFSEWIDGDYISMVRDPNWWGDKVPGGHAYLHAYPDSVVFRIIPDQTTAANALKNELIDVAPTLDANTFVELRENEFLQERYDFLTTETFNFYFVAMNNKNPLLEDKRVRRALAHVLDVQIIIDAAFAGLAVPVPGPVAPSKAHANKDLPLIVKDIEKAKALLSEAGWEDTNDNGIRDKMINGELVEMEMEYLVNPGSIFASTLSEVMKDGASQVGVSITIVPREPRVMVGEDLASRNYALYGYGAGGNHLLDDFMQLWHTSSNTPRGSNRWQFGNAETDALIEKINVTIDPAERHRLYQEFQRIVYDEQPLIFLFSPMERMVVSKRWEGNVSQLAPNYILRDFKVIKK